MKKAIALAVSLAAAAGAHADWATGAGTTPQGELLLTVWNPEANKAFSQDLGVLAGNALSDSIATNGLNLTLDSDGLAFVMNGGTDYSKLQWNVIGASFDVAFGPAGYGWYFTSANPGGDLPQELPFGSGALGATKNNLLVLDQNLKTLSGASLSATGTAANPVFLTQGDLTNAGDDNIWGGSLNGFANASGLAGTSAGNLGTLGAWSFNYSNTGAPNPHVVSGTWMLDAEAGSLTYSAVPVPAAAWLFGSALVGLAGIGRRRKA